MATALGFSSGLLLCLPGPRSTGVLTGRPRWWAKPVPITALGALWSQGSLHAGTWHHSSARMPLSLLLNLGRLALLCEALAARAGE